MYRVVNITIPFPSAVKLLAIKYFIKKFSPPSGMFFPMCVLSKTLYSYKLFLCRLISGENKIKKKNPLLVSGVELDGLQFRYKSVARSKSIYRARGVIQRTASRYRNWCEKKNIEL